MRNMLNKLIESGGLPWWSRRLETTGGGGGGGGGGQGRYRVVVSASRKR